MTEKASNKCEEPVERQRVRAFHIEIDRSANGISVLTEGVIGINDFTDNRAVLATHGGKIEVTGKRLSVVIYEHSRVEIVGVLEGIRFVSGKR